ncbi:sensor histidine kinase [Aquimarina hainanensis]|uniref:Oxygen sensor histidine kinase NreB n=1 Tax=Aquimarina hainanensis TaxID=1578017 RepID=A0ABW5NA23_9FLAO|nr:ATP-binding protein [Aquimarina sp. TRL1]QKX07016.1 sensor histidine kinase [Aquimarina sp. TRL1]
MEKKLLAEDSQIIVIILVAITVLLLMAVALIIFFFFSRKKIVAVELDKANLLISYQKDVLHATLETQEEERKRIAQDLHDAISAKLNVVSLSTNMLIDGSLNEQEQKDMMEHILTVTTNTLESSRRLAHNLLPPILENFGLQAALEELCDEFIQSKQLKVDYKITYNNSLEKKEELHIFRIVQEFLNNAVRHGEATEVSLIMEDGKEGIKIKFTDNGKGFDLKEIKKRKGIGLKNIESRIEILKGAIEYFSEKGEGVTFNITIKKI